MVCRWENGKGGGNIYRLLMADDSNTQIYIAAFHDLVADRLGAGEHAIV